MSIIRIPENEYEKYITQARANQSNQVYPLSIAEGKQSGDIFVDAADSANRVLFWHYCGFAYLSGAVRAGFLDEIYEEFFLKEQNRRFLFITDDLTVIRYFSGKPGIETVGDVSPDSFCPLNYISVDPCNSLDQPFSSSPVAITSSNRSRDHFLY